MSALRSNAAEGPVRKMQVAEDRLKLDACCPEALGGNRDGTGGSQCLVGGVGSPQRK
jgi:hypothetical protein